jgi:error-prone DNA polymerase
LIEGMQMNGLTEEYAERIFRMIQGFGAYGFPESHAASFALIGYASCYLKRYHPAAFLAALLDSQPMGFYANHTLVSDAQRHGVEVRPVSVASSRWDSVLEEGDPRWQEEWWGTSKHDVREHTPWADRFAERPTYGAPVQPAVRLGFREISGMSEAQAKAVEHERSKATTIAELIARARLPKDVAMRLAAADAFSCFGVSRREALWKVMAIDRSSPLFATVELPDDLRSADGIPEMDPIEEMRADFGTTGLTIGPHPMKLVRERMRARRIFGFAEVQAAPHGRRVRVGGMVVTRQRPGTASGIVFMTLEDEDGHVNLVVFSHIYERYRHIARDEVMLIAEGQIQKTNNVTNVIVDRFERLDAPEPGVDVGRNFF